MKFGIKSDINSLDVKLRFYKKDRQDQKRTKHPPQRHQL